MQSHIRGHSKSTASKHCFLQHSSGALNAAGDFMAGDGLSSSSFFPPLFLFQLRERYSSEGICVSKHRVGQEGNCVGFLGHLESSCRYCPHMWAPSCSAGCTLLGVGCVPPACPCCRVLICFPNHHATCWSSPTIPRIYS